MALPYLNRAAIDNAIITGAGNVVIPMTLAGLGALIAPRQPHNRIGWILLGISGVAAVNGVANQAAIHVHRMEALRGSVEVQSSAGKATSVTASLPVGLLELAS